MAAVLEIDHTIGFATSPNCLHYHPSGENYLYCSGWKIGIGHLTDSHNQRFVRNHDDAVTCLTLSQSGRTFASGQRGENCNIYVCDYDSGEIIFSFEEHDSSVRYLAFSQDERLLVSIGDDNDGKLIIWDLSNGCIVAASPKLARGTTCVCFGGFVKDIKRRNTTLYQLCTGGSDGLYLWQLDPYSGDMNSTKVAGDARGSVSRHVTAITFSQHEEYVYAATSSGDYLVANVKNQHIVTVIAAAKKGLYSLVSYRDGLITGGGDGSLRVFSAANEILAETSLSGSIVSLSISADSLEVISVMLTSSPHLTAPPLLCSHRTGHRRHSQWVDPPHQPVEHELHSHRREPHRERGRHRLLHQIRRQIRHCWGRLHHQVPPLTSARLTFLQGVGPRRIHKHRHRLPALSSALWSQASLHRLYGYRGVGMG
jgi:WD40 repeat protein